MTEDPNNEKAAELESIELPRPMPSSLKTGIWVLAITVVCVAGVLIAGYPTCCLFALVTGIALPLGGVAVILGLFQKSNRTRPRLWHNLATLTAIVALLYLLTFGLGGPIGLLNLRMRGLVALTGGQDALQSWAVDVLAKPRDRMEGLDWSDQVAFKWAVPREHWSKQVRRLDPKHVRIERLFQNDQEGVRLMYGGGFLHWYIVLGPPGSVPDPKFEENLAENDWFRWSDGVYCWFPD